MNFIKPNKNKIYFTSGITLIALVITIIVLLILTGVTISTLTGDNGILTKAKEAKTRTEEAEKEEENLRNTYLNELNMYPSTNNSDSQLLTSQLNGEKYGYSINYSANNINNWSIFYNDTKNIYIISNDYITCDLSSYSSSADAVAYLKNSSEWSAYATGVNGSEAYGAPDVNMLLNSYNSKYNTNYDLNDLKNTNLSLLNNSDSLYIPSSSNNIEGYWLSTTYYDIYPKTGNLKGEFEYKTFPKIAMTTNNFSSQMYSLDVPKHYLAPEIESPEPEETAWVLYMNGDFLCRSIKSNYQYGLRCVVKLPQNITGTVNDSDKTVTIK